MRYIAFPSAEGEIEMIGEEPNRFAEQAIFAETLEELDQKLEAWLLDWANEGEHDEWVVVEVVPHSRRVFTARMLADKVVITPAEEKQE